jgi:hypothetical protein
MDFSKEISDFQKTGKYEYQFDEGGNLVFNSASLDFQQHFLSICLANYSYDDVKIQYFYDLGFKEFIPTSTEITVPTVISSEIINLTEENKSLKDQLTALTVIADANQTESDILATKQVILSLRIQSGQGKSERDFSEEFPYVPFTKNTE